MMTSTERWMRSVHLFKALDFVLVGLVLFLCVLGVILIGSVARNAGPVNAPVIEAAFRSQIVWLVTGVFILLIVAFIDYQFVCRFYVVFAALSIAMLVVVLLIPPLRPDFPSRWLHIPGYSAVLQPSEFSKVFMIIFFAKFMDKFQEKINKFYMLAFMAVVGLIPVVLINIQPSLTASILQLVIFVVMLFLGGIKYKYIITALLIALPLFLFFIYDINREEHLLVHHIFEPFQLETRIKPRFGINVTDANMFQSTRSVHAIGSGSVLGLGLFGHVINVPLAHNDFIFSVIGAEFGFVGSIAVIAIIFLIVLKCFIAAHHSDSLCGRLLAAGVGAMIGVQTFVHIGVNTMLLPNTGIPMPFLSAGGSSMWINLAAIGMVLNIGMKPMRKNIFLDS